MTDDKIDYEKLVGNYLIPQSANHTFKFLTRDDYPDAKLKVREQTTKDGTKGVSYNVSVTIPRPIRHLFSKSPEKYLVARKTEADYHKRRRSLTEEIYKEFDRRQAEFKQKHESSKEKLIEALKKLIYQPDIS